MRKVILIVGVILVVSLSIWLIWYTLSKQEATKISPVMENFIAQAIIDAQLEEAAQGYKSPEGAIVAHVMSTTVTTVAPIRVWSFSKGQLIEIAPATLVPALDRDSSKWPSFTFVFALVSMTSEHVVIDVHTLYNRGIAENSRGGYASTWEFTKDTGNWVVTSKEIYMYWD